MAKLVVVDKLRNQHLLYGLFFGCEGLYFNEQLASEFLFKLLLKYRNPQVDYGYRYRISGSKHLQKALELATKEADYSGVFDWNGLSFKRTVIKKLYWLNFNLGGLSFLAEKKTGQRYHHLYLLNPNGIRTIKLFFKFIKRSLIGADRSKLSDEIQFYNSGPRRIGVAVKHLFDFELLKPILKHYENEVLIILNKEFYEKGRHLFPAAQFLILPNPIVCKWNFDCFKYPIKFWEFLNLRNESVTVLSPYIKAFAHKTTKDLSCLLIVEGENYAEYASLRTIVNDKRTVIVTVMNGMKAGEGHDGYVDFDYWALWDQDMVEYFNQQFNFEYTKLLNLGHLGFNLFSSQIRDDGLFSNLIKHPTVKYYSVFLSGNKNAKLTAFWTELFRTLNEYAEKEGNTKFLMKEHPSNKFAKLLVDELNAGENLVIVDGINATNDQIVYNLIDMAELVITFGSTTALYAKWLNKICVNFELSDETMLYLNNEIIPRVRTIKDLLNFIENAGVKTTATASLSQADVTKNYIAFIDSRLQ